MSITARQSRKKGKVLELISNLSDKEIGKVETFVKFILFEKKAKKTKEEDDKFLQYFLNAPEDDEPLTDDDIKALEEADEDIKKGRVISHEAVRKEILGK